MIIGERIKIAREKKGLTQNQLGELIETDGNTISRWERGIMDIKAETLLKIALALKTPVTYLFGEDDEGNLQVGNVHVAGSISEAIVNGSGIVIVRNGREQVLSDELSELVRLYEMFDVRRRMALLNRAFELEGEMQESKG